MLPAYATFNPVSVDEQVWYPDSAAASHMTPDDGKSLSKSTYSGNAHVKVGNGTLLPIEHVGNAEISTSTRPLRLRNVLHVPKLQHNLLSVKQLCRDNNCSVLFDSSCVRVQDKTTGDVLLQASSPGHVYTVPVPASIPANLALTGTADLVSDRPTLFGDPRPPDRRDPIQDALTRTDSNGDFGIHQSGNGFILY